MATGAISSARTDIGKKVLDVIETTTKESEDPFYVVDLGAIVNKYRLWQELLPRVHPY